MNKQHQRVKLVGSSLTLLFYIFLYLPIFVLVLFSFNETGFPAPWSHFSLRWYRELFEEVYLWSAFQTSLIVALMTTLLSLTMGISLIFYASQGGKVRKFLGLFFGNLIIPETVLAVSLLGLFSILSVPLGYITLIVAHSILGLGFVVPILYGKYSQMDKSIVEASMNLGASPFTTFRKVTLPMLRHSIVACALLTFILSFDDFIFSYFCSGSATQTLPLYILANLRSGLSPILNALSAILFMLSSLFALLFFYFNKRSKIGFV